MPYGNAEHILDSSICTTQIQIDLNQLFTIHCRRSNARCLGRCNKSTFIWSLLCIACLNLKFISIISWPIIYIVYCSCRFWSIFWFFYFNLLVCVSLDCQQIPVINLIFDDGSVWILSWMGIQPIVLNYAERWGRTKKFDAILCLNRKCIKKHETAA